MRRLYILIVLPLALAAVPRPADPTNAYQVIQLQKRIDSSTFVEQNEDLSSFLRFACKHFVSFQPIAPEPPKGDSLPSSHHQNSLFRKFSAADLYDKLKLLILLNSPRREAKINPRSAPESLESICLNWCTLQEAQYKAQHCRLRHDSLSPKEVFSIYSQIYHEVKEHNSRQGRGLLSSTSEEVAGAASLSIPPLFGQRTGDCQVGAQGPVGPKGVKGSQGLSGVLGPKGFKGDRGNQGPKGIKGTLGTEVGADGDRGMKGDKGMKGDEGDDSPKGDKGEKGDKGDSPATGDKGPTGNKGNTGDIGDNGDPGEDGMGGDKASKGAVGSPGTDSDKGARGPQGSPGTTATKGDKGLKGGVGPQGDRGDQGARGDPGDTGPTGSKGEKGTLGDQGNRGNKGEMGDANHHHHFGG